MPQTAQESICDATSKMKGTYSKTEKLKLESCRLAHYLYPAGYFNFDATVLNQVLRRFEIPGLRVK